ncbi:hypothetical protein [Acanthamoeba polyphaga mimivirus]|nr:hypothetical protein [Acanthamoeba castellanii mamavirus]AHA45355.1 hypothetical protein HIRU_S449 [Hirudovirus strain Sangsue]UMZ07974.1 hypothetical protein [Acanthamoeba polyphaga mimivirus]
MKQIFYRIFKFFYCIFKFFYCIFKFFYELFMIIFNGIHKICIISWNTFINLLYREKFVFHINDRGEIVYVDHQFSNIFINIDMFHYILSIVTCPWKIFCEFNLVNKKLAR